MKQKKAQAIFRLGFSFYWAFFASWCPEATEARSLLRGISTQIPGKISYTKTFICIIWREESLSLFMPLPYCVYILFSEKDHLLYIGYSANLEKRIETHNSGGNKSTAYRRPLKLIFCELYLFEEDARKREMYFKTTAGKKAIKLMLIGTLSKLGYKKFSSSKIEIIYESSKEVK